MILIGSLVLTFIGTVAIFIFEYSNFQTIGQFSLSEKIINSFFTSMSTRTAGFNSFDMSLTHDYTNIICAIFMFIGKPYRFFPQNEGCQQIPDLL